MFEKTLHRKLLKDGEQGQGVVTERHVEVGYGQHGDAGSYFSINGHIRFPDGSQTEFQAKGLDDRKFGLTDVGTIVPVRYDPTDHSKVILDVVALEAQHAAEREQARASDTRQNTDAIAKYDAGTEVKGDADPKSDAELQASFDSDTTI